MSNTVFGHPVPEDLEEGSSCGADFIISNFYIVNTKCVLKRVSLGSEDYTKKLKLEYAYFLNQTS